ncbi:PspC domain-containing protein [Carnobacterium gallinarum]|uniref:PspC domain-containing protein n=1 Tax=Carnobacterium gallinarum TaxID=2749 RepID=UPI0005500E77|nr:PspC domain-containing protein [Carnobacterium gallinarum]
MNKLEKSRSNRVVSGVLGGLGEYFNIDPTILRIIYVVLIVCGFGSPVILYIVLAFIMPEPTRGKDAQRGGFRNGSYYTNDNEHYGTPKKAEKRKEAEKFEDDDWSDF